MMLLFLTPLIHVQPCVAAMELATRASFAAAPLASPAMIACSHSLVLATAAVEASAQRQAPVLATMVGAVLTATLSMLVLAHPANVLDTASVSTMANASAFLGTLAPTAQLDLLFAPAIAQAMATAVPLLSVSAIKVTVALTVAQRCSVFQK